MFATCVSVFVSVYAFAFACGRRLFTFVFVVLRVDAESLLMRAVSSSTDLSHFFFFVFHQGTRWSASFLNSSNSL